MILEKLLENINTFNWIDFGIGAFIALLVFLFILKVTNKFRFAFLSFLLIVLTIGLYLFNLKIAAIVLGIVTISGECLITIAYSNRIYKIINKSSKTILDEDDEFYNILEEAVINLSKSKTGALITIEKDESLKDYIEKGKPVHAPVNADLLRSIFYVGTPLHDGAVIIKKKMIESASVYFTPTTRAMPGKYGARHRAAIGFSETHSSITIVVSEETGRINFAVGGELIPASHETFKKRLHEYLEN